MSVSPSAAELLPPASRPNILLILTDQLRADALGCFGGSVVATPQLDALAASGTVFDRCYVNNPICTPSRASLWTGKTVPAHGVMNLHDVLPDAERLFTADLQAEGYRTGLFGKLHVSGRLVDANEMHPHSGFDVYENALSPYNHDCRFHAYRDWLAGKDPAFLSRLQKEGSAIGPIPDELHFSTWVAERASAFVADAPPDRPFFCCASFVDPHDPFDDHPPEYLDQVSLGEWLKVERTAPAGRSATIRREEQAGVLGALDDYSDDEIVRMRRSYFASVAFLDVCVGRILAALQRSGRAHETLIIFTSDHGEMLGERCLLGKGAHFYESCARVPLLVRWPGSQPRGNRSAALVQLHDLAATVLSAAGIAAEKVQARMPDALPLQDGRGHAAVFGAYRNSCINRQKIFWDPPIHCTMVRRGDDKLTVYHGEGVDDVVEGELYNLAADPHERRNLWTDPSSAALRAELTALVIAWDRREGLRRSGAPVRHVFPPAKKWLRNNPIRLVR